MEADVSATNSSQPLNVSSLPPNEPNNSGTTETSAQTTEFKLKPPTYDEAMSGNFHSATIIPTVYGTTYPGPPCSCEHLPYQSCTLCVSGPPIYPSSRTLRMYSRQLRRDERRQRRAERFHNRPLITRIILFFLIFAFISTMLTILYKIVFVDMYFIHDIHKRHGESGPP